MEFHQLSERDQFIVSRWAYSVNDPIITNAEYTLLLNFMQSKYPDDEYVKRSWSSDPCPVELLRAIGRTDLITKVILSDKTESIPSLNTEVDVLTTLSHITIGTLSMKHDGWNIQANYFNGELLGVQTRGRATDAMDVSKLSDRVPQTIPAPGSVKVVMELTISKENFRVCVREFGNVSERSAVSTVLARPDRFDLLSMHAVDIHGFEFKKEDKFRVLSSWGFDVPLWVEVHDYSEMRDALAYLSNEEPAYAWPTDGAVIDSHICYAIRLLAWEEPIYQSYVIGYIEQYNIHRISPSVRIYPILRKRTTQKQINLTNWQRIIDYDLRPGSPIAFRVASSAIADFDAKATALLKKEYEGKWDIYQQRIRDNEEAVRCSQLLFL